MLFGEREPIVSYPYEDTVRSRLYTLGSRTHVQKHKLKRHDPLEKGPMPYEMIRVGCSQPMNMMTELERLYGFGDVVAKNSNVWTIHITENYY